MLLNSFVFIREQVHCASSLIAYFRLAIRQIGLGGILAIWQSFIRLLPGHRLCSY
jgi:hypothetical protein